MIHEETEPLSCHRLLQVQAFDGGFPTLRDTTFVDINVIRVTEVLSFFTPSYTETISENQAIASNVITVTAQPAPNIVYRLVGYSDGPDFFNISSTTGTIQVRSDLRLDLNKKSLHYLLVEATKVFANGVQTAYATVNITVQRNLFAPTFDRQLYEVTVMETVSLGTPLVQLTANDQDVFDELRYNMVQNQFGTTISPFYIGPFSGLISLREVLTNTGINTYQFTVTARDQSNPEKTGTAAVRVNVLRSNNPPVWVNNAPYNTAITNDVAAGTTIFTQSRAVDSDLTGTLTYRLTGQYFAASFYFAINSTTGDIYLRNNLNTDAGLSYTLGLVAFDDAYPLQTAVTNITIGVNRNQNAPVFNPSTYVRTISEDYTLGLSLVQVEVSDNDGDFVTCGLQNLRIPNNFNLNVDLLDWFYMNPYTCLLTLRQSLVSLGASVVEMDVRATDDGIPPRTSQGIARITINIFRNENDPFFVTTPYVTTIPETTEIGTNVITVSARDTDDLNQLITYQLVGDDTMPTYFSFDTSTGEIAVRQSLLQEVRDFYVGRIVAYDAGSPPRSATVTAIINISRNLNRPIFNPAVYNETILETASSQTVVVNVRATDADRISPYNQVFYEIQTNAQDVNTYFEINRNTGDITVRIPLYNDPTDTARYTFIVLARDGGNPQQVSTQNAQVTINVIRNLNAPVFQNQPYETTVPFFVNNGVQVYDVLATDIDTVDPYNRVSYSIIGDDSAINRFSIDNTGSIRTSSASIQGDVSPYYIIRVLAQDGGTPRLSSTATVYVGVERNQNSPGYAQQNYTVTVNEIQDLGIPIITLNAFDQDIQAPYNTLVFNVVNNFNSVAAEYLDVSVNAGEVYVRRSLTLITNNQLVLEVSLRDADPVNPRNANVNAFVTVNIIRNENSPVFVNLPCDVSLNQNIQNQFLTQVTAQDADSPQTPFGQIRYSIIGDDNAVNLFSIDEQTGRIVVVGDLSQQNVEEYRIRVQARDLGAPARYGYTVCAVGVQRNFQPPFFVDPNYSMTIIETYNLGDTILTVSANDNDPLAPHNTVRYRLTRDPEDLECFLINEVTGDLALRRSLLYEPCRSSFFFFSVRAEDLSYPFRSSTALVTVNVIRNNAQPQFTNAGVYDQTVDEDISVLEEILTVSATDSDDGINGDVFYSIVNSPAEATVFQIGSESGVISARISLIGTSEDVYRFTVRASDKGLVPRTNDAQVTIRIRREGLPFFSDSEYVVTVPEDLSVGSSVFNLDATEPRVGSTLVYDITGEGSAVTTFRIDDVTGLITLSTSLLSNSADSFVVRVRAYRSSFPDEFASTIVRVFVTRNANAPVFQHGDLTYSLSEDQSLGVSFGGVDARDSDLGRNGEIRYNIREGDAEPAQALSYFYVDPYTGTLSVTKSLNEDVDQPNRYRFYIVAYDQGVPSLSAAVRVTVNVIRNRNGPIFRLDDYAEEISEFEAIGRSVLRVRADDADNDQIVYSVFTSASGSLFFDINPTTGVISVAGVLTQTGITEFQMVVMATDVPPAGSVAKSDTANVVITVRRNPNGPVFTADTYEATISEYKSVQQSVVRVAASDADPDNTPSGTVDYSIIASSYTPNNGFDQFVISQTEGSIYISQPLTREFVPNTFELIVQASDKAAIPKVATATVVINIIRNQYAPIFNQELYSAAVVDFWATGRELFVATAVDDDRTVDLSRNTPNAEFDYIIDPEYPYAANYFDITKDGVVYVRSNLQTADGRDQFEFYLLAVDKSWKPLSSRALVRVNVTYTNIVRRLGFAIPEKYLSISEDFYVTNPDNSFLLDVTNRDENQDLVCEILFVNGQTNSADFNLFRVATTVDRQDCVLSIVGNLDREIRSFWNVSLGVREVIQRNKRQVTVDDYVQVFPSYARVNVYITILDVNDNAPAFQFPAYPVVSSLPDRNFYITALSLFSDTAATPLTISAIDPDAGDYGVVHYQLSGVDQDDENLPFYLSPDNLLEATREFNYNDKRQFVFSVTAYDSQLDTTVQRRTTVPVYVDLIENANRFILVLNENIEDVNNELEAIRVTLQNYLERIVIIERVTFRRYLEDNVLNVDFTETDVHFVVVNHQNRIYNLFSNVDDPLNLVTLATGPSVAVLAQVKSDMRNLASVQLIRRPLNYENLTGISDQLEQFGFVQPSDPIITPTKSYVWWMNDPWAAFIALSAIVIVLGFIAIAILLYQWHRYSNYLQNYRVYHRNYEHQPDFTHPPSFLKEYETQTLDMYMPPDETVQDLGEINLSYVGRDSARLRTGTEVRTQVVRNPAYDNQYHVKYGVVEPGSTGRDIVIQTAQEQ